MTILIKFPTNFITAVCAFCYKIHLHSISVVTLAAKTIRSDFFCGIKKQGSKSITLLLPRYSYIISTRLFFVVVMTAVVAVAAVKVKVKLCAAIRALGRTILNGSAVEIYGLAA